jgi:hypothetical protein
VPVPLAAIFVAAEIARAPQPYFVTTYGCTLYSDTSLQRRY